MHLRHTLITSHRRDTEFALLEQASVVVYTLEGEGVEYIRSLVEDLAFGVAPAAPWAHSSKEDRRRVPLFHSVANSVPIKEGVWKFSKDSQSVSQSVSIGPRAPI